MTSAAPDTEWLASLPKKRIAVAGVFLDGSRRVVLLSRTYADGWVLPGGMAEAGESLSDAFQREIYEELGLCRKPGRLLCLDWVAPHEGDLDGLVVVFDGGTLSSIEIATFAIPNSEISGYRFAARSELAGLLADCRAERVKASLRSLETEGAAYMESRSD